jgi:hypothetical protein
MSLFLKRTLGFSPDDLIISIVMGCKKLKSLSLFMPDLQDCHIGTICMHLRSLTEFCHSAHYNAITAAYGTFPTKLESSIINQ